MLTKAIEHGKEHRKPYRKAKAVDRSCRNHGSCPYCANGRQFKHKRAEYDYNKAINDYFSKRTD